MNLCVKQISGLEKVRTNGIESFKTIREQSLLGGESFSYQLAISTTERTDLKVSVSSPLSEHIKLYEVKNTIIDFAVYDGADDDYLTKEPGIMPDILIPIESENEIIRFVNDSGAIWVSVKIPENTPAGSYPITVSLTSSNAFEEITIKQTLTVNVIGANIPKQKTIFTQWFHVDCIADVHNVPIYSEEHWDLIDKYMSLASDLGINMILTPVITPPLDTEIGTTRPCTQLVKIEKQDEKYLFNFSLLKRWIELANKNNMKYFEISHLFSQWGLKYAPNIKVYENGKEDYMFGWHTDSQSEEYRNFLNQFIPSLIEFFKSENIKERCYFHISDEPSLEHMETYKYAYDLIKPLIEDCNILDAISNYDFYGNGLISHPVTATSHIEEFFEHEVKNQWAYYCCGQINKFGNRFLAMPSYRNRILGLQLYKFNVVGFLQWGYNFYYSQLSRKKINPYLTTSADKGFPSGDSFSVYPVNNGVVPSLRALIFKEALEDIEICRLLESYIGRDAVIEMIDTEAKMNVTFSEYPRNTEFIPSLINKMRRLIKKHSA